MKKTAEVYELTLYRPLGGPDLYRQLLAVARAAIMDGNRCALASAIASIFNSLVLRFINSIANLLTHDLVRFDRLTALSLSKG